MPNTTDTSAIERVVSDSLETFGAEAGEISRSSTFEQLDIDSLDIAELAQIVEDEFGVAIRSSDAESLKTVGDVVDLIAARV